MRNYELRAKLFNLTLAGKERGKEMEWIGTKEQWNTVESYLTEREKIVADIESKKEADMPPESPKLPSNER